MAVNSHQAKTDGTMTIAILDLVVAALFCFLAIWLMVLRPTDIPLNQAVLAALDAAMNERNGSERYMTNLFALPAVYGIIIATVLALHAGGVLRRCFDLAVYVVSAFGVLLTILSLTYGDGFSLVMIATIIVLFGAFSTWRKLHQK